MPVIGTREAPASPVIVGPWVKVVELVGFRSLRGVVLRAYLLECGHEVERDKKDLTHVHCEHCARSRRP